MADAFGKTNGGSGSLNVKRFVTTPAFLIIAGVAVLALVWLFFRGRQSGNAGAQNGNVVANPVLGPPQGPEVLSTLDTTGLQEQLSNLTQQVSTGFAQGSGSKPMKGTLRGNVNPDTGQSFGSATVNIPYFGTAASSADAANWGSIGTLQEQSQVNILGPAVQGAYAGGGNRWYYPIQGPGGGTDFVLAQDISGFGQQ